MPSGDILDELFPACAPRAFVEQAIAFQEWPDRDATGRLAFELYEESLAQKHR